MIVELLDLIPLYDQRRNFVGGSPWGGVALDKKNGIVYVTTGNPQPSLYGVNRLGTNHRSASLIAVDLKKKRYYGIFRKLFMICGILIFQLLQYYMI